MTRVERIDLAIESLSARRRAADLELNVSLVDELTKEIDSLLDERSRLTTPASTR